MTPYRTPAAAPSAPPRPTWRRRLAATLLPARWRCGRAARGGHWCQEPTCDSHYAGRGCACLVWRAYPCVGYSAHPGGWRTPPCEDHGPPVAPLRLSTAWRWRLAARVGLAAIVAAAGALAGVAPHWLAGGAAGLLISAWVAYCNERLRAAWGG